MYGPVLDQFRNDLWWKVVPVVVGCGIVGIVVREVLQWLERKATQIGRSRRAALEARPTTAPASKYLGPTDDARHCPACDAAMVKRTARRGANFGSEFWRCSG